MYDGSTKQNDDDDYVIKVCKLEIRVESCPFAFLIVYILFAEIQVNDVMQVGKRIIYL